MRQGSERSVRSRPRYVLLAIGLAAATAGVLVVFGSTAARRLDPTVGWGVRGGRVLQQPGPGETPFPTETDPLAERREKAAAFAANSPEAGSPAVVVPTITEYLQDEDPVVRTMGVAAIGRISLMPIAWSSGLRDAARDDPALVAALFNTVSYEYNKGYEDKAMRAEAARVVGTLWLDSPNATVEAVLAGRYDDELVVGVRAKIVTVLCEHGYTSSLTRDVILDATEDYDINLAQAAQACYDRLFP